jgi:hypothetical protein
MTPDNFNWFLHTMLFYHTQYVIQKKMKMEDELADEESTDENSDED